MVKRDISLLTEAQSTLLMPLWARAMENQRPDPLLRDHKAVEIVDSLDFNFDSFLEKGVPQADYCVRASVLDQFVGEFITKHPTGTVVEFGVGLDTRFDRLDNGSIHWIELDLPDVVDLRLQFFQVTERRRILKGSLTNESWIEEVKSLAIGPTLFIAEGVLYFLTQNEVSSLLKRLVTHFPKSSFLFDAQSPWYLWFSNIKQPVPNAELKFSLGSVKQLEKVDSQLKVERWVGFGDSPHYDRLMPRISSFKRWSRKLLPGVRRMFKIVKVSW